MVEEALMAGSSGSLHEDRANLAAETVDRHRAVVSLMEELEAMDWYDQRIDATTDETLAEVLRHNCDEEKEHAAMILEWLRRRDVALDHFLRTYLFTDAPITAIEALVADSPDTVAIDGLGIGALRGRKESL